MKNHCIDPMGTTWYFVQTPQGWFAVARHERMGDGMAYHHDEDDGLVCEALRAYVRSLGGEPCECPFPACCVNPKLGPGATGGES